MNRHKQTSRKPAKGQIEVHEVSSFFWLCSPNLTAHEQGFRRERIEAKTQNDAVRKYFASYGK